MIFEGNQIRELFESCEVSQRVTSTIGLAFQRRDGIWKQAYLTENSFTPPLDREKLSTARQRSIVGIKRFLYHLSTHCIPCIHHDPFPRDIRILVVGTDNKEIKNVNHYRLWYEGNKQNCER